MELSWVKTYDECLNYFNTDPEKGLTLDQVKKHQEKYGPNGEWHVLIEMFISILITFLMVVFSIKFCSNFYWDETYERVIIDDQKIVRGLPAIYTIFMAFN